MNAIDTNVLLRYLLQDEPGQSRRATELIRRDTVLVTDIVLAETLWVLAGGRYQATKEQLAAVISAMFEDRQIVFEAPDVVWQAFNDFLSTAVDFQDALIMRRARAVANEALLYTFDGKAQALEFAAPL